MHTSIRLVIIAFMFTLIACKNQSLVREGKYVFDSENRRLTIQIIDDKNLLITNFFDCNIEEEYKNIVIKKQYFVHKNMIIIANPDYKEIVVPYYNEKKCPFLSEKYREDIKRTFDGRTYFPNKSLYSIPNIDTLKIDTKGDLYYYKKTNNGTIGFLFKNDSRAPSNTR